MTRPKIIASEFSSRIAQLNSCSDEDFNALLIEYGIDCNSDTREKLRSVLHGVMPVLKFISLVSR